MPQNFEEIIKKIEDVLKRYYSWKSKNLYVVNHGVYNDLSASDLFEMYTLLTTIIEQYTFEYSHPERTGVQIIKQIKFDDKSSLWYGLERLAGVASGLKYSYQNNLLQSVDEIIRKNIFQDFLEMAEYLLHEGGKDFSAVIVSGILEEHLRKLYQKNGLDKQNGDKKMKTAGTINDELYSNTTYSKLDHKNITAWIEIRNNAAHAHWDAYTDKNVEIMLMGVRDFILRNPA